LNNETTLPWVHSISYGEQVASAYPTAVYQERLDVEFQKIGSRGITIIFASGDSGAGCAKGSGCACSLSPAFPATSTYVTAIGATKFLSGNSGPEGAVSAFLSGGGFANGVFPTLSYQQNAVSAYFQNSVKFPPDCSYNKSGRGTPDASSLGDIHFQVYQGGHVTSVGGTSAAAPTFAAVITLLNDIRLHAGKPTLGYLNQWIYQTASSNPSAFFDVTVGGNSKLLCCGLTTLGGFECTPGWDPVTGVGTPNFEVLKTLV
jgi:tripeptidyl-peptidase-1